MISSTKRLHNEMINFETDNAKIIPPNKYYIINITVENKNSSGSLKSNLEFIESQLSSVTSNPLSIYYSVNKILLTFSSVDDNESHQLNGNSELIISKYMFSFTKNLSDVTNISAKIIQFSTQIEIFAYVSWIIYQTTQETIIRLSKGVITSKELHFRTEYELINILETNGVSWEKCDSSEKYGTLMKLGRKKNSIIVVKMSESFDSRENKKYLKFMFG